MSKSEQKQEISRTNRLTVLVSDAEESDVRLVASFHRTDLSTLMREWAMRDIQAEAENIRAAVVARQTGELAA